MIVVTGATGQLGSQVVAHLLTRVPADAVGVSVRDPAGAAHLAARGVRVRRGDFTEPATLAEALDGADRVLVVSASIRGPGAAEANAAALRAAAAAGAGRVLYTSHQAASPTSLFAPQPQHAATETVLAGLGVAATALRNGFYASTLGMWLGSALETGRLATPQDGPVSWTAHDDLAEVAAVALTDDAVADGLLDGISPPLTGPEALDLEQVAGLLTELSGRTVSRVVVEDDEWVEATVGTGMPPAAAEFTLGLFRAARAGEFAVVDPTLEVVLGRPATPVRAVLQDLLASGGLSPAPR